MVTGCAHVSRTKVPGHSSVQLLRSRAVFYQPLCSHHLACGHIKAAISITFEDLVIMNCSPHLLGQSIKFYTALCLHYSDVRCASVLSLCCRIPEGMDGILFISAHNQAQRTEGPRVRSQVSQPEGVHKAAEQPAVGSLSG